MTHATHTHPRIEALQGHSNSQDNKDTDSPSSHPDISGAKASIIAMANNTLPLAQLVCGLTAGAFVQHFVESDDSGSDSVAQTGVEGRAVRNLFTWGGVIFGGLEIILLFLMQCTQLTKRT